MDGMYRRKIGMLVGAFNQEMALVGRSLLCDYRQASCGPLFEARLLADQSRASVREKGGDISMNLCVHCNCPSRGTAHSSFQNSMNKYVKEIFFLKCEILKVVIYMSPVSLFGHHINHFQAETCVSMLSRQCKLTTHPVPHVTRLSLDATCHQYLSVSYCPT